MLTFPVSRVCFLQRNAVIGEKRPFSTLVVQCFKICKQSWINHYSKSLSSYLIVGYFLKEWSLKQILLEQYYCLTASGFRLLEGRSARIDQSYSFPCHHLLDIVIQTSPCGVGTIVLPVWFISSPSVLFKAYLREFILHEAFANAPSRGDVGLIWIFITAGGAMY